MQHDVDSIKSQDSGSIDPSWNPFREAGCAGIEDSVTDQYFDGRRESEPMEPSDLRDEEEWGSCLEDSNFGNCTKISLCALKIQYCDFVVNLSQVAYYT